MRAIDADALKEDLTRFYDNEVTARKLIDEQPTIQPAEPKRGRWIYCEDSMANSVDGYRCDQCGFFVPWDYKHKDIDFIQDYNFCPSCGAKMEAADGND